MSDTPEIGVLLVDPVSGAQIGFIKFDPSGMLAYQAIKKGLSIYAFKPIDRLLTEHWFKVPLYKKYAGLVEEKKRLPNEVLEREASSCADFLNSLESPLTMADTVVKAQMVSIPSTSK